MTPLDLLLLRMPAADDVLLRAARDAQLDLPDDVGDAAAQTLPFRWLVERVGPGGLALTSSGYLRPADVSAAMSELRWDERWVGTGNREVHTRPVLELRQSAQSLGLLRKSKGRLTQTKTGAALADDPVGLRAHVADRLPLGREVEREAGLLLLLAVAAGVAVSDTWHAGAFVARGLDALGWGHRSGRPLEPYEAIHAAQPTRAVLRLMRAIPPDRYDDRSRPATAEGRALARLALRT